MDTARDSLTFRRARCASGLTQQQLADRAGVSRVSVSKIERGEQVPNAHLAAKLAGLMGVTVAELWWSK